MEETGEGKKILKQILKSSTIFTFLFLSIKTQGVYDRGGDKK